jgi:hypothetical protein
MSCKWDLINHLTENDLVLRQLRNSHTLKQNIPKLSPLPYHNFFLDQLTYHELGYRVGSHLFHKDKDNLQVRPYCDVLGPTQIVSDSVYGKFTVGMQSNSDYDALLLGFCAWLYELHYPDFTYNKIFTGQGYNAE